MLVTRVPVCTGSQGAPRVVTVTAVVVVVVCTLGSVVVVCTDVATEVVVEVAIPFVHKTEYAPSLVPVELLL